MDQLNPPGASGNTAGQEGSPRMEPESTQPTNHEAVTSPDIFSSDPSHHVKTGLAKGISMMWEGKRQWEQYDVPTGSKNVQAKLLTESDGYHSGQTPDRLVVNMVDGIKSRTIRARVRSHEFYDPPLNLSDYDWAPRYPESTTVVEVDDIRTVRLEDGTMVTNKFKIERRAGRDTNEATVKEDGVTVEIPLSEEEAQGMEMEWDWEGDLVDTEPNTVRYSQTYDKEGWIRLYGYRDKKGFHHSIGPVYDSNGKEVDSIVDGGIRDDEKGKIDAALNKAGDLASPPHENLADLVGKEIKREGSKDEQV